MKLWDKGYDTDALTERFTVGRDRELDVLLAEADVEGSDAHLSMLEKVGLVDHADADKLHKALSEIMVEIREGRFSIADGVEDVHSQVEFMLTERCGEAGKKIHTGRSRNDQVLVDLKLYSRRQIELVAQRVERLFNLLLSKAEQYADVLMPGYTHLQVAMPSSFGLWFSAYAESLAEDMLFLGAAYRMVNTNPLGSGAGYGSSAPLDRDMTTRLLGFEDLAVNSVYAQMQRGKTEKNVLFGIASVATTIGRLAADVCLYMCSNFGFVGLPDAFTTGSSIMPHKKNPDIFELVRANCNLLQALPNQVAMISTNLTSGYFRDMQLTKELYMPAFARIVDVIDITVEALENIRINPDILDDERYKYLFTVEDVNELVARGVPFRDAYRTVGMSVQNGTYRHEGRTVSHTHQGSIGNLCLDRIRAKFERYRFVGHHENSVGH